MLALPPPPPAIIRLELHTTLPKRVQTNWRTEYVIDGAYVGEEEVGRRWAELEIVEIEHSGGWVRLMRFKSKR